MQKHIRNRGKKYCKASAYYCAKCPDFCVSHSAVKDVAEKYKAQEQKWIPVKYHEITDKEREENCVSDNVTYWLDCKLPEDGEEILIVRKWRDDYITEHDTCYEYDGYYLDMAIWALDLVKKYKL